MHNTFIFNLKILRLLIVRLFLARYIYNIAANNARAEVIYSLHEKTQTHKYYANTLKQNFNTNLEKSRFIAFIYVDPVIQYIYI